MKGRAKKKLTISGTLLASTSKKIDLRQTYPSYSDALPFDTMTLQASKKGYVEINDNPNQRLGLISKGAYAYPQLNVWTITVVNADTVNALDYDITLEQSGEG